MFKVNPKLYFDAETNFNDAYKLLQDNKSKISSLILDLPSDFESKSDLDTVISDVDTVLGNFASVEINITSTKYRLSSMNPKFNTIYSMYANKFSLFKTPNMILGNLYFDMYSDGNGEVFSKGHVFSSEPDPSSPINFWKGTINPDNYIYPKDSITGLSLGAWPKDYSNIPAHINSPKVYNDDFIWPTTPVNNNYTFVYEHNGIDIMTDIGTPIYSPVDGTLEYSEWGHTINKGSDETAYSVSIKLDKPVNYDGVEVDTVFLTHMSGIRYRTTEETENTQRISKGELIGFAGNAAGSSESVDYAPHLHMTLYNSEDYDNGLTTSSIEKLYEITDNTKRVAGE